MDSLGALVWFPSNTSIDSVSLLQLRINIATSSVVLFLGVFCCIHKLFEKFVPPPEHLEIVKDSKQTLFNYEYWKWKNLCISWAHALGCGLWVITNAVLYPHFVNDLILHFSYSAYFMVCFSVGYFIYDFVDMWRNRLLKKLWELAIHHVAITAIMVWNLVTCSCIGWNIIALSAEINSFFLHSRKLLQIYRVHQSSILYKTNMAFNFLTFVVFRFGSNICIFLGLFYQRQRVSSSYYFSLACCLVVMCTINPVLFIRLIKTDLQGHNSRKTASHLSSSNGCHKLINKNGCPSLSSHED